MPSWLSCPLSELVGPPWWWLWLGLLPLPFWSLPLSSPPDLRCSAASSDFRCIPTGPQSISSWLHSKSWLKLLVLDDWAGTNQQKKIFQICWATFILSVPIKTFPVFNGLSHNLLSILILVIYFLLIYIAK